MLKENEDLCSVLHPKTAFETLLTLQLLESGENGGQHTNKHNSLGADTIVMQDCQSAAVGGA